MVSQSTYPDATPPLAEAVTATCAAVHRGRPDDAALDDQLAALMERIVRLDGGRLDGPRTAALLRALVCRHTLSPSWFRVLSDHLLAPTVWSSLTTPAIGHVAWALVHAGSLPSSPDALVHALVGTCVGTLDPALMEGPLLADLLGVAAHWQVRHPPFLALVFSRAKDLAARLTAQQTADCVRWCGHLDPTAASRVPFPVVRALACRTAEVAGRADAVALTDLIVGWARLRRRRPDAVDAELSTVGLPEALAGRLAALPWLPPGEAPRVAWGLSQLLPGGAWHSATGEAVQRRLTAALARWLRLAAHGRLLATDVRDALAACGVVVPGGGSAAWRPCLRALLQRWALQAESVVQTWSPGAAAAAIRTLSRLALIEARHAPDGPGWESVEKGEPFVLPRPEDHGASWVIWSLSVLVCAGALSARLVYPVTAGLLAPRAAVDALLALARLRVVHPPLVRAVCLAVLSTEPATLGAAGTASLVEALLVLVPTLDARQRDTLRRFMAEAACSVGPGLALPALVGLWWLLGCLRDGDAPDEEEEDDELAGAVQTLAVRAASLLPLVHASHTPEAARLAARCACALAVLPPMSGARPLLDALRTLHSAGLAVREDPAAEADMAWALRHLSGSV